MPRPSRWASQHQGCPETIEQIKAHERMTVDELETKIRALEEEIERLTAEKWRLRTALADIERWSNGHLVWAAPYGKTFYRELRKPGDIARSALGESQK